MNLLLSHCLCTQPALCYRGAGIRISLRLQGMSVTGVRCTAITDSDTCQWDEVKSSVTTHADEPPCIAIETSLAVCLWLPVHILHPLKWTVHTSNDMAGSFVFCWISFSSCSIFFNWEYTSISKTMLSLIQNLPKCLTEVRWDTSSDLATLDQASFCFAGNPLLYTN